MKTYDEAISAKRKPRGQKDDTPNTTNASTWGVSALTAPARATLRHDTEPLSASRPLAAPFEDIASLYAGSIARDMMTAGFHGSINIEIEVRKTGQQQRQLTAYSGNF